MSNSILQAVKGVLGISEEDTSFDADILMWINAALTNLQQLGVGPTSGIQITGATELWDVLLLTPTMLGMVRMYISLKVRVNFDPPTNAGILNAMISQITEYEQRLLIQKEVIEKVEETV